MSKKKINYVNSKRSKRINSKSRGKSGKKAVFRGFQKQTTRKSARFYFRSKKPSTIDFTQRIKTTVLSLDASKGKQREITDGKQVIPLVQKIRKRIGFKKTIRESISVVLKIKMESGKIKYRTVTESSNHPDVARRNNKKIAAEIDRFLKEGASKTKTAEKIWLTTVTVKRFYQHA